MGKQKWWKRKSRVGNRYASFSTKNGKTSTDDGSGVKNVARGAVVGSSGIVNPSKCSGDQVDKKQSPKAQPHRPPAVVAKAGGIKKSSKRCKPIRRIVKFFRRCCCCCARKKKRSNAVNPGCCGDRSTKDQGIPTDRKCCSNRARWSGLLCCCLWLPCCACCSCCPVASCTRHGTSTGRTGGGIEDEEDDIDAAFAAYKMQLKANTTNLPTTGDTVVDFDTLTPSQKSTIRKLNKNAHWGWNDSFRSVSDRFLETLELDDMMGNGGENSLRKKFNVCCRRRLSSPFRERKAILGEIELG